MRQPVRLAHQKNHNQHTKNHQQNFSRPGRHVQRAYWCPPPSSRRGVVAQTSVCASLIAQALLHVPATTTATRLTSPEFPSNRGTRLDQRMAIFWCDAIDERVQGGPY